MANKQEQFGSENNPEIPAGLKSELKGLFRPGFSVPAEVDRAVLDRAFQRILSRQRRWHRNIRLAGSVAAAAAIIIFACIFLNHNTVAADIDRNGRVDILDAYKLARHIESADSKNKSWDINGDGLINQADVDVVAMVAVHIN
jgi:hypothetical protein